MVTQAYHPEHPNGVQGPGGKPRSLLCRNWNPAGQARRTCETISERDNCQALVFQPNRIKHTLYSMIPDKSKARSANHAGQRGSKQKLLGRLWGH